MTGGVSRNPVLAQMFADALAIPVTVPAVEEAAAYGAALCAGAAVGMFASPKEGARATVAKGVTYQPDAKRGAILSERYAAYSNVADALAPHWRQIEALAR